MQRGKWELFSSTLLVELEVAMLKYGSPLHSLKSTMRRKEARTCMLAWLSGAGWGQRARVLATCVNGPPKFYPLPCGVTASFYRFTNLVFGYLAFKFVDRSPKQFRS